MDIEEVLKVIRNAKRRNLTTLDLFYKKLTTLPPEIGQLTNLTGLYLYKSELTTLPPEIGQLTNLTGLN
ncbi:MAG TPA: leucine-rich repeat domain-containing protein, partial [Candidatus Brocadiia bacterium]